MTYEVTAVESDYVEVWDGKTKDEWLKPSTTQFFGEHMNENFAVGDKVAVQLVKL